MLSWHKRLAFLFVVVLLAGCGPKSINHVLADPGRYRNQNVTVRGTVDQSVSLLGRGAYRIVDGDQGLWVVTNSGTPRQGARVNVTGRVQDGFDLSGLGIKLPGPVQNGLVLVESSRTSR